MYTSINKCNWSGDIVKIRINQKNKTLSLYGVCGEEKWETFKIKKINIDLWQITHGEWKQPLGYINQEYDYFKAYNGYLSREHKCMYVATAQFLYNIL